jgi:hypothetical protein
MPVERFAAVRDLFHRASECVLTMRLSRKSKLVNINKRDQAVLLREPRLAKERAKSQVKWYTMRMLVEEKTSELFVGAQVDPEVSVLEPRIDCCDKTVTVQMTCRACPTLCLRS